MAKEVVPQLRRTADAAGGRGRPDNRVATRTFMIGQPVDSTNLVSVDYDEWSATLTVEFRNDTVYEYYRVPPGVYAGLMRATSHGGFLASHIRNRFSYRLIQ